MPLCNVVFILARGGSKRLPGKNIKLLGGKPLIAYAIETASHCEVVKDVVVSSDCEDILNVSKGFGNCHVLERPSEFATDSATSESALLHALEWYEKNFEKVDNVILMQPTSPFSTPAMIEGCLSLLEKTDSAMTVVSSRVKCEWVGEITDQGYFKNLIDGTFTGKTQYIPSGNVYAVKANYFKQTNKLKNEQAHGAHTVSMSEAVDIDYLEDFNYAQFLIEQKKDV